MDLKLTPARLTGTVTPPPSKSLAHRVLIAAALAAGESAIERLAFSADIEATLGCMERLGAVCTRQSDGTVRLRGVGGREARDGELPRLDCNESGSTLRFLIPVALALRGGGVFSGRGRLLERPQQPYFDLFDQIGIAYERSADCLTVRGALRPGRFALPGNVSSQFISGLLFALPLLDGDSELILTTPLESAGYVRLTLDALAQAGITVTTAPNGWRIPGGQHYQPLRTAVEADWSQAAFFLAAAALGSHVQTVGLNPVSDQGDAVFPQYSAAMTGTGDCVFDVSGCPDLVPPLAVQAALRPEGCVTRLINAGRLRAKESDRLAAVTAVLNALGAQVEEQAEALTIRGVGELEGGVSVDSHNDHRIAMMAAVAATRCRRPIVLRGADCVRKSYPDFWEVYAKLGGKTDVLDLR